MDPDAVVLRSVVLQHLHAGEPQGVAARQGNVIDVAVAASGVPYDASHPAFAHDVISVYVSGLDQTVLANPGRLQVTVNGQSMSVQPLTPAVNGQTQINFSLAEGFSAGVVSLAVVVDGSSSVPVPLTVH